MNLQELSKNKRLRHALPVLVCTGMLCMGWPLSVHAQGISQPAGVARLHLSSNTSVLASMPFSPIGGDINTLLTNQLVGTINPSLSDRFLFWDTDIQQYITVFKADQTGDGNYDGYWFEQDGAWTLSTQVVDLGEAFWVVNKHDEQDLFLFGLVNIAPTQSTDLVQGFNLFGYPYLSAQPLNATDLDDSGTVGGTNMAESDLVIGLNPALTNWYFESVGDPEDGTWRDESGAYANTSLNIGRGFWYQRNDSNTLYWQEIRPYANVFADSNAPAISDIYCATNFGEITLLLAPVGVTGEILEVFYRDLDFTNQPAMDTGWTLATEDITATGTVPIAWSDAGSASRSTVTAILCRVYAVGRQDLDADGDQLSDGRETLVYDTLVDNSDTDADGLSDGDEVLTWSTSPTDSDTDDDQMSDKPETDWGFDPTADNSFATLPWQENFDALALGALHDQNGWTAPLTNSVLVQTGVVAEGSAALEIGTAEAQNAALHYFGAAGITNVWVDMRLRPVLGALPETTGLTNPTALLAFDTEGRLCGYDGASQEWVVASITATGDWMRITIGSDYANHCWRVNDEAGLIALEDLGFLDTSVSEFSRAAWRSSRLDTQYVDSIVITDTEPGHLDDDGDAMPNIWERLYGLNVGSDDSADDADADGLANLTEYQLGTGPRSVDTDNDGIGDRPENLWGLDPVNAGSYDPVPWSTGFEANQGYADGSIDGQDDWTVLGGTAVVQQAVAYSGAQGVRLDGMPAGSDPTSIQHYYGSQTGRIVWTEMRAKLVPGDLPDVSATNCISAVLAMDSQGRLAGYDGTAGQWVCAASAVADPAQWQHITVQRDYTSSTWTLFLDDEPVLSNLGFADAGQQQAVRIVMQGAIMSPSHADDLALTYIVPAHIDSDQDDITDRFEDANTNGVVDTGETDFANPDSDADGMIDGTEQSWGFDALTSNQWTRLPWNTGFEFAEGYLIAPLATQQQWNASPSVDVADDIAYAGTNAVCLTASATNEASMERFFGTYSVTELWVEAHARLNPGALPAPGSFDGTNSVCLAVGPEGVFYAYDGTAGDWQLSDMSSPVDTSVWTRLVFRINYTEQEWSFYCSSNRIFHGLGFMQKNRWFSRLRVQMGERLATNAQTWVDGLSVSAEEPANLDNDGDGIVNAWERLYGLDPENADDAYDDADLDGLSNLEEYQLGISPVEVDTDGDGLPDYDECNLFGTDPAVDDDLTIETVNDVQGYAITTNMLGDWQPENTEIVAVDRNGYVEYSLTAPSSGLYRVELFGGQNQLGSYEVVNFDLRLYLDGEYLARRFLQAAPQTYHKVHAFTPWIEAGTHTLRIRWLNCADDRRLSIRNVRLQSVSGDDLDANGVDDFVDSMLAVVTSIDSTPAESCISPVCLEGRGRYLSMMDVLPVGAEPSCAPNHRWYLDLPLYDDSTTVATVSFQNGASVKTASVDWVALNLLSAADQQLRCGDTLRMTAVPIGATNGTVNIAIAGVTNWSFGVDEYADYTFTATGDYEVVGTYTGSSVIVTNSITVSAFDAAFSHSPACRVGDVRIWDCTNIPAQAVIEYDDRMREVSWSAMAGGGLRFNLDSDATEPRWMIARLGDSGPVMTNVMVEGIAVYRQGRTYTKVIETYGDGSQLIEKLIVLSSVPDGLTIDLEIIVSGITFYGGGLTKTLTASDFDELGGCAVRFVRTKMSTSAICHTIKLYQHGIYIGN